MDMRRILGGLAITAALSVLFYAVLAALADVRALGGSLIRFSAGNIALMIALTLAGYALRALRWRYLASLMGHEVRLADAFYIQFSTITMTVTPGKVGEVLKAYLGRKIAHIRMSQGLAFVFTERLADLIAVTVLSAGGISAFRGNLLSFGAAVVVVVAGTLVARSRWFHKQALRFIARQRWARRHHASSEEISRTVRTTLRLRPLTVSIGFAILSWGLEGLAFSIAIRDLGFVGLSVPAAVAVYAASTIIGALAFFPGGVGLSEVSMVGLLVASGVARADALAATLLIRFITVWLSVGVGWAVFATRPAMIRSFTDLQHRKYPYSHRESGSQGSA